MEDLGYKNIKVIAPDINEKEIRDSDAAKLTMAIAQAKNKAILQRITEDCILITSDQVITL